MMKKTVLVSGGAGFIGSHVTVELIEAGYDVVVADNMSNCDMTGFEGVTKIIGRRLPFIQMDFCDMEAVDRLFSEYHIDAVIHFAAFKAVGESIFRHSSTSSKPHVHTAAATSSSHRLRQSTASRTNCP